MTFVGEPGITKGLHLVAPDSREEEVRAQLRRPAFNRVSDLHASSLSSKAAVRRLVTVTLAGVAPPEPAA